MGGDGTVAALGDEDGVGVRGLGRLGLGVRFGGRGLEGDGAGGWVSCVGRGGRTGEDAMGEEGCLGGFTGLEVAVCLLLLLVVV